MTQSATISINGGATASQSAGVGRDCVASDKVHLVAGTTLQPDFSDTSLSVSVQPFKDTYVLGLSGGDAILLDNCAGSVEKEQIFQLTKSVQSGALIATQYYPSAPTQIHDDYDRIAAAVFTVFAKDISADVPTTLVTAPLDAKPHTSVSKQIMWDETFKRALVTESQGKGIVIGSLTVEVPVGVSVDQSATNAQAPVITQCA